MEVSALQHAGVAGRHGRSPLLRLQTDERLIALIRRGNHHAFEALVSRYQPRLLSFCRHMLGSKEDAEDVLQEVFAAAFNAILADERAINVRPWLYRIARNRSLNHLRRVQPIGVDSMDIHFSEQGTSTADKVHKREDFRMLIQDVQGLPETQRTALLLREIDALSYEQIAEAMETTVPSVKSLLVRARVSLAEAAEARQMSCDVVRARARRGRRGPQAHEPAGAPPREDVRSLRRVPQAAARDQQGARRRVPDRAAGADEEVRARAPRHRGRERVGHRRGRRGRRRRRGLGRRGRSRGRRAARGQRRDDRDQGRGEPRCRRARHRRRRRGPQRRQPARGGTHDIAAAQAQAPVTSAAPTFTHALAGRREAPHTRTRVVSHPVRAPKKDPVDSKVAADKVAKATQPAPATDPTATEPTTAAPDAAATAPTQPATDPPKTQTSGDTTTLPPETTSTAPTTTAPPTITTAPPTPTPAPPPPTTVPPDVPLPSQASPPADQGGGAPPQDGGGSPPSDQSPDQSPPAS